nr:immunoglobulin heavy chain junction region [Macaca mulatta]MOX95884.1 immunoglobulin heavy chain junction region [Macaca mulatta]
CARDVYGSGSDFW